MMIDHTTVKVKLSSDGDECALDENNTDNISDTNQDSKIRNLEEKLRQLEEENLNLEKEIYSTEKKYHEQLEAYLARYINADFSLAQMQYILPMKRAKLSKLQTTTTNEHHTSSSSNSFTIDANPLISLKHFFEPSVNLVYKKLRETTIEAQNRYRQSNDDMLAWRFSPESSIGKSLMSRIRHLLNANEELGRVNQADRVSKLESEAELQATCIKEFIKANEDIESVVDEAYTDLEGLQNSLLILHQQINQTESVVEALQNELESRQPGIVAELMSAMLSKLNETEETTNPTTEGGGDDDDNATSTPDVHDQPPPPSEEDNLDPCNNTDEG
uniref:Pre-mRNA-splicing regulator female-lethal(2)D n=2 Tax=Trichobilharzia regenti TaxID=157069 RepID=A0AA85IZW9_TRIRE|nr:unnamed protein product [Trichobilharzia regenti]